MTASRPSLDALREEIDRIDAEMAALYEARMNTAKSIASYKHENDLPIYVPEREQAVIDKNIERLGNPEYREMYRVFITFIMQQSKELQNTLISKDK